MGMGKAGGSTFKAISDISKACLQLLRKLRVLDYFVEDPLAIFEIFKNCEGFGTLHLAIRHFCNTYSNSISTQGLCAHSLDRSKQYLVVRPGGIYIYIYIISTPY